MDHNSIKVIGDSFGTQIKDIACNPLPNNVDVICAISGDRTCQVFSWCKGLIEMVKSYPHICGIDRINAYWYYALLPATGNANCFMLYFLFLQSISSMGRLFKWDDCDV